ncbi:hypothetical protein LUZ60_009814 [Juncus effusus]|nr:hypothetical protein LUZ60_009814 [Juncus effusus]
MAPPVPWSDLPIDILLKFLKPLEVRDIICFSAVCSTFESAASLCLKQRAPSPWIVLEPPSNDATDEIIECYYDLCEEKVWRRISRQMSCCSWPTIGSSHGWLVKADNQSNLHLINPITNRRISLPPIVTMEGVYPVYDNESNMDRYMIQDFGEAKVKDLYRQFTKVVLSKDPSDGDYIVILVHYGKEQGFVFRNVARTLFTKAGDKNWTLLPGTTYYEDFVFRDGLFYGVADLGGIYTFNFSGTPSPTIDIIIDEPGGDDEYFDSNEDFYLYYDQLEETLATTKHLVLSPLGDILAVWQKTNFFKTIEINVNKVDLEKEIMVKLHSIGDYSMFVGTDSGCFYAKDSSGVKSNSAYFIEKNKVKVYDLTKRSLESESFSNLFGKKHPSIWMSLNPN